MARPHAKLRFACAALTVGLLTASTARADDARSISRAAFLHGVSEAHLEHFTAARDDFLEAYRLFPHPSILLNLGVARLHTGEYLAAEDDLVHFLAANGGSPPEDLASAQAALVLVRRHLGTLRLRVATDGATATLDGVPIALAPTGFTNVRAAIGPAELRVTAPGYALLKREVVIRLEAPTELDVTLAAAASADEPPPTGATGSFWTERHRVLGWSLLGSAGALALVGTVAGAEAIAFAHEYNTPGTASFQDHSTRETGVAWRTSADVLFATSIVVGAAGAFVLLRPLRGASVGAAFGPMSLAAVGRF